MLCDYGCGKEANYQLKNGKHCCSKRPAGCEVEKEKNRQGTKRAYESGKRIPQTDAYNKLPQDTKDRMNWAKGKSLTPDEEVFIKGSTYSTEFVKKRILKDNILEHKCAECGIDHWNSKVLVLELDHINGNNRDNRIENLRFLCPNCHSQTDTFRGRNINSGLMKVSDEALLTAYKKCGTIRKALIEVGLAPKGGNYARINKLINASMVE